MSDDDEAVIMATPTAYHAKGWVPVAGSVEWTARCGHRVWIAPSSVQLMADPGMKVKVMCIPCVKREDVSEAELTLLPGQMDEVQDEVGRTKREQLEQALKGWGFKDYG